MNETRARAVLALVVLVVTIVALKTPTTEFWADGATYHAMARSLAEDGDLRYEARDIFRIRREFPSGPQGIFLKRASGGLVFDRQQGWPWVRRVRPDEPRLYFAKAFLYPLFAAPFVKIIGTRGLILANLICFGAALWLGYAELRRFRPPPAALAGVVALYLLTITPLYVLWLTPEVFNLALVTGFLCAWSRGHRRLAAIVLACAMYSKPYNFILAIPLLLEPFLERHRSFWERAWESMRRGVIVAVATGTLFGVNRLITGEMNYQGGERKTFYGVFPLETREVTFGNSGEWMTTDQLGPLVEGRDESVKTRRTGPLRAPHEIRDSFVRNLGYFWIGRFAGALPYFAPFVVALIVFLVRRPREATGVLAALALGASYLFYIVAIPDNWYGGGGTVGNRYFLNLLPLGLFLIPRGREKWVALVGGLISAILLFPAWLSPLRYSLQPGTLARRGIFRLFPPELTMLNDLSVFTEPWRKKRPIGDTEGDPHKHWPADPKAYWLYFLDDGTFGKGDLDGREGFWLRGGTRAEIIVRALEPVTHLYVWTCGGPVGDEVRAQVGGRAQTLSVASGECREAAFEPGPGFVYYDSFVYRLKFRSARGGSPRPPLNDPRSLGAFVEIHLDVQRRAPRG